MHGFFITAINNTESEGENKQNNDLFALHDPYTFMAYFLEEHIGVESYKILNEWGLCELIVSYGNHLNNQTFKNYLEWEQLHKSGEKVGRRPNKVAVKFIKNL